MKEVLLNRILLLSLLILFLVSGCSNNKDINGKLIIPKYYNKIIPFEKEFSYEIHFCRNECCGCKIIEMINQSNQIRCAFFELDNEVLKDLILRKDGLIILDKNYNENKKHPNIRYFDSAGYMHNKFCVLNHDTIITGSFNPTENGDKNDNNLVIINSKYLSQNYLDEFSELWNEVEDNKFRTANPEIILENTTIKNFFCPEDCSISKGLKELFSLIASANHSIKIAVFAFTHDDLADALISAKKRGVDVRVIIDNLMKNIKGSEYSKLNNASIHIKTDSRKEMMHHKVIIIDDKIVVTGSPNFSDNAFKRNDENFLIVYNKQFASRFVEEFDRLMKEN